jgi:hypothetical protein
MLAQIAVLDTPTFNELVKISKWNFTNYRFLIKLF